MAQFSSLRDSLEDKSYKVCSSPANLDSVVSVIGSAGVPGEDAVALCPDEKESLCINACLDARLLISLKPTRSPLLKLPFPCLNSQRADSGEPV
jgi:hypothetical protein